MWAIASQNMWLNQMFFLIQWGKSTRTNNRILPILPKGQNKSQFKAPEAQRLSKRHARTTVTRPNTGMYREPGRDGS